MTDLKLTSGVLTVELPGGITAVRIDTARRIVAVDGVDSDGSEDFGPEWTIADLRDGTYGGFHRLEPADECFDVHCANSGEHVATRPEG